MGGRAERTGSHPLWTRSRTSSRAGPQPSWAGSRRCLLEVVNLDPEPSLRPELRGGRSASVRTTRTNLWWATPLTWLPPGGPTPSSPCPSHGPPTSRSQGGSSPALEPGVRGRALPGPGPGGATGETSTCRQGRRQAGSSHRFRTSTTLASRSSADGPRCWYFGLQWSTSLILPSLFSGIKSRRLLSLRRRQQSDGRRMALLFTKPRAQEILLEAHPTGLEGTE